MSKYTQLKRDERSKALEAGVTEKLLREPTRKKFRVVNPMRMVERVAIKKYKDLNWKERTNANKHI